MEQFANLRPIFSPGMERFVSDDEWVTSYDRNGVFVDVQRVDAVREVSDGA